MKRPANVLLLLALLALPMQLAATRVAIAARCDASGADAAAIADARTAVAELCDCAAAATHGAYLACSRGVLATLVGGAQLPKACRGAVQACAARSTCGRAGAVTCCRTSRTGVTSGSIKTSAAACRAPQGGAACVGDYASLCDACDASGCAPACGNGKVEPEGGEECEPPGTATCDATCKRVPTCGNGFVDSGEACDGAAANQCASSSICGGPSDALACQCCSSGTSVFYDFYAPPFSPAPCCDGTECRTYAPHFCTCDASACVPAGAPCSPLGCCAGLTCNGTTCE